MANYKILTLALICASCSVYSVDDRYLQEKWGTRSYAERVCAQGGLTPGSSDYSACVDDKARRRLALIMCPTNAGMYFKEDICEIAE